MEALVALGANLPSDYGQPAETLAWAVKRLKARGVALIDESQIYRTPAFPGGSGPDYANQVIAVRSSLAPAELLAVLHAVEDEAGRAEPNKRKRWGPRSLDLDLIAVGEQVAPDADTQEAWRSLPMEAAVAAQPTGLVLPHPFMQDRAFVLVPLAEIRPEWRHPLLGQTAPEMLANFTDAALDAVRPLATV
ncbi:MAG: 2-amino-4-hydroxy-6-hydroxymethyldihydropteridine diphosphokinase [Pseudomonadota bacterium]